MDPDISKRPCSTTVSLTVLQLFAQDSFDLSDMPVRDGVEAARQIRALEVERGYDILLPSKPVACDVLVI